MASRTIEKPKPPPKPIKPEQKILKATNSASASTGYSRQIIASLLQELGLPNDTKITVRLKDARTGSVLSGLDYLKSAEADLTLEGNLSWNATKQGNSVFVQTDTKEEATLAVAVDAMKAAPTLLTILRANDVNGHIVASAPTLALNSCNLYRAVFTSTIGGISFNRNSTIRCADSFTASSSDTITLTGTSQVHLGKALLHSSNETLVDGELFIICELSKTGKGQLLVSKNGKIRFCSSNSRVVQLAVESPLICNGSLVSNVRTEIDYLELNLRDSVFLTADSEWIAGNTFGRVEGKLTLSGRIEWDKVGVGPSTSQDLVIDECLIDPTCHAQFKQGGKLVVNNLFHNRSQHITWSNLLDISTNRFLQDQAAGFVCPKGKLKLTIGSMQDMADPIVGKFEVAQFVWKTMGHVRCSAEIQVGLLKATVSHGHGITFLSSLIINGPLMGDMSLSLKENRKSILTPGHFTFAKSGTKLVGCIYSPRLVVRLENDCSIILRAHLSGQLDLFHIIAYDLFTEPGSVLHLVPSKTGTSVQDQMVQIHVANSWNHRGKISAERPVKAMRLVAGKSVTLWPSCQVEFAEVSALMCEGKFVLEKGTSIEGKSQLEISAKDIEFKPKSQLICLSSCHSAKKGNTLMIRAGNSLKNDGIIKGENLILAASGEIHNSKGALISSSSSLTIGSITSLINDGMIRTQGPLRIIAGKLDNFYGQLISENESIYVELYSKEDTKVSGLISTSRALIVRASQSSRLKMNVKLNPEASPQLIFVSGSISGETIFSSCLTLRDKSVARFLVGSSLKFAQGFSATVCEIGVIGEDGDVAKPASIYFEGSITVGHLKVTSAAFKTANVSIRGSGTLKVDLLVLENLASVEFSLNVEVNQIVIRDVAEMILTQGAQLICHSPPILNDLKSLTVDKGAFASFNGTIKMSSGRLDCSGTIAIPNGNIICREFICADSSRLILGTAGTSDEISDNQSDTAKKHESTEDKSVSKKEKFGKKVAMFAASAFFGDPFVQTFLPKLSKLNANKTESAAPSKPTIYIAGAEALQLNGYVICPDRSKNLMLLCDAGSTIIKGLIECDQSDVAMITCRLKLSGTINCSNVAVKAIESMKFTRKASLICHKSVLLKAGKLERKKSSDENKSAGKWSKDEESKLRQFGRRLKECFTSFPSIVIRGKIVCTDLVVRAKIVVFALTKDIKVVRSVNVNAWLFANLLAAIQASRFQFAIQIFGVNLGALLAWKSFSVTCLSFVNLAFIHAPLLTISAIVSLLLVGATCSFSRIIKAIVNIELLHAGLPTVPTKELLKNPIHIINALLTTLQQLLPLPARAAVMIAQSGLMLLGLFKTVFTLAVKLKGMVEAFKETGIVDMRIQLTDIIDVVVDCVTAWTIFEAGVKQINQGAELTKLQMPSTDEFEVDLEKAAITLIGNYCLPTMNEVSVFSQNSGLRLAFAITDRGVYGHNDGITLAGNTYMADYVTSYVNHGIIQTCGDIIVSSKYLEMVGDAKAYGDVKYQAENLVAKNILAFGDFRALVESGANISNASAKNVIVETSSINQSSNVSISDSTATKSIAVKSDSANVSMSDVKGETINAFTKEGNVYLQQSQAQTVQLHGSSINAESNTASDSFKAIADKDVRINRLRAGDIEVTAQEGSSKVSDSSASGSVSSLAKYWASVAETKAGGDIVVQSKQGNASIVDSRTQGSAVASASMGEATVAGVNAQKDVIVSGSSRATIRDVDAAAVFVEGDSASARNINANYLKVEGKARAVLEGVMTVDHAQVKADAVAFQNLSDQVFGKLEIRAEKALENLEAILYRSQEFSKLQISDSLNLDIPRQDMILNKILHAGHALSINANSISVQANISATAGDVKFDTKQNISVGNNANIAAEIGKVVLHSKTGDISMGIDSTVSGREGAFLLADAGNINVGPSASVMGDAGVILDAKGGAISVQPGAKIESSSGNAVILSKNDVSLNKATLAASGKAFIRSEQGNVTLLASKTSGEESAILSANKNIEVLADVQARDNGKAYDHSVIQGGKGQAYEAMERTSQGEQRRLTRNFGVIMESDDGSIILKCSDIQSKGDVAMNAKNGSIDIDADSYQYVASQEKASNYPGLEQTTVTKITTHVESPTIQTDGFLSILAGDKVTSTSASIKATDGFEIRGEKGVKLQDIVKVETTQQTSEWFGGIWKSNRQWDDTTGRVVNVIAASGASADSSVHSGRNIDLRGAQLSSGRSLQLAAGGNISIDHSSVVSGQMTTINSDGKLQVVGSHITSTDGLAAIRAKEGINIQSYMTKGGSHVKSEITSGSDQSKESGGVADHQGWAVKSRRDLGIIIEQGGVNIKGSNLIVAVGDLMSGAPVTTTPFDTQRFEKKPYRKDNGFFSPHSLRNEVGHDNSIEPAAFHAIANNIHADTNRNVKFANMHGETMYGEIVGSKSKSAMSNVAENDSASLISVSAGTGISFLGGMLMTNMLSSLQVRPLDAHHGRVLNNPRTNEERWRFYFDAPLASVLANYQEDREAMSQWALGHDLSFERPEFRQQMSSDHPDDQKGRNIQGIISEAAVVNAQSFRVLDFALQSVEHALFSVREFVTTGSDRQNCSLSQHSLGIQTSHSLPVLATSLEHDASFGQSNFQSNPIYGSRKEVFINNTPRQRANSNNNVSAGNVFGEFPDTKEIAMSSILIRDVVYTNWSDMDLVLIYLAKKAEQGNEGAKQIVENKFVVDRVLSSDLPSGQALVMASQRLKQVIVAFRGSASMMDALEKWLFVDELGETLPRQAAATNLLASVKDHYSGYKITAVGNSLGATVVAHATKTMEGLRGIIFIDSDDNSINNNAAHHRIMAQEQKSPLFCIPSNSLSPRDNPSVKGVNPLC